MPLRLLLVLFDFGEFGVAAVFVGLALAGISVGARGRLLLLLVDRLAKLHRALLQRAGLLGPPGGQDAFDRGLAFRDRGLAHGLLPLVDLVATLGSLAFGRLYTGFGV